MTLWGNAPFISLNARVYDILYGRHQKSWACCITFFFFVYTTFSMDLGLACNNFWVPIGVFSFSPFGYIGRPVMMGP